MAGRSERTGSRRWWWVTGAGVAVAAAAVAIGAASGDETPPGAAPTAPSVSGSPTAAPSSPAPSSPGPSSPAPSSPAPQPSVSQPPVSLPPVPTEVPDVSVPVPPVDDRTPTTVAPDQPGETGGVAVEVARVEIVAAQGSGPGQVSGPAYALTLTLRNGSGDPYDPRGLQVSLFAGADGVPLISVETDSRVSVPTAVLAPGADTTATYVFAFDDPKALPLAAFVDLAPDLAPVVFDHLAPR